MSFLNDDGSVDYEKLLIEIQMTGLGINPGYQVIIERAIHDAGEYQKYFPDAVWQLLIDKKKLQAQVDTLTEQRDQATEVLWKCVKGLLRLTAKVAAGHVGSADGLAAASDFVARMAMGVPSIKARLQKKPKVKK